MWAFRAALAAAFVAVACGGTLLDEVAAIQVEVVQFAQTESGQSPDVPDKGPISKQRANASALPSPVSRGSSTKAAVTVFPVLHTRGYFNSLITILIFTGLALLAITFYCCVTFSPMASEPHSSKKPSPRRQPSPRKQAQTSTQQPRERAEENSEHGSGAADGDTKEGQSDKRRSLTFASEEEAEAAFPPRHSSYQDPSSSVWVSEAESGDGSLKKARRSTWSETAREWGSQRWSKEEGEETMGATAFVVNIVADLCPSGFLSITYGMDGTGYIWAIVIMVIFYALCVYTMWCCGRTCEISGEADFASQWALVIGPGGSWIPLLVIVIVAFGALLCYACYFGDLLEEVMPALGMHLPRYACLICFSLFPALPLCLLKNLSALAYSSFFAFLALIYTALVMIVRLADGSYAAGGRFLGDLREDLLPDIPEGSNLFGIGARSLLFINILAMAFHCHCNACKYYRELKDTTPRHFRNCTMLAMGIALVLYAVMGFVGFKTFGSAGSGTILKNYSLQDMPVNVARVLISLSLVASYAIMFSALREAFVGLVKHIGGSSVASSLDYVWRQDVLSGILVALITICGVVSQDSGLVDGFVGAFCGNAIIYIIPCLLYAAAVKSFLERRRNRPGLAFSIFLVVLGVLLAIAGCICIVVYEVEAEPTRPVQHHWKWVPGINDTHQPQTIVDWNKPDKRALARGNHSHQHHHEHHVGDHQGPIRRARHIWAMR